MSLLRNWKRRSRYSPYRNRNATEQTGLTAKTIKHVLRKATVVFARSKCFRGYFEGAACVSLFSLRDPLTKFFQIRNPSVQKRPAQPTPPRPSVVAADQNNQKSLESIPKTSAADLPWALETVFYQWIYYRLVMHRKWGKGGKVPDGEQREPANFKDFTWICCKF